MTFDAQEISIQDGQPLELYEFTAGVRLFFFTSAPEDYTYASRVYTSLQLSRSEIEDSGEIPKSSLTLESQRDFAVADLFRVAPPSDVVVLNIYRLHLSDGALERKLLWTGRVLNCEWTAGSTCSLTCESLYSALLRRGLRRLYQRQCPHVLYGAACTINADSWKTVVSLVAPTSTVSGVTVSDPAIDALADGYFAGGYLEYTAGTGVIERRGIRTHVGAAITLTHAIPSLVLPGTVNIYAGCDHSIATCLSKFANVANYGGFPYIPKINPFGGSNVF
jgi:uncharacterized phage protein (TIGR02218 family)